MPTKKKASANAFMCFTLEWKSKYGKRMTLAEATAEAGKIWAAMSPEERNPYKGKAKEEKEMLKSSKTVEKLSCTGTPLSFLEKEKLEQGNKERQIKRDIETTVRRSVKDACLEDKSYYFVMVNYFTKTLKGGVYVPAELSICEYSLKGGVKRMYHNLINPGVNLYGHHYEAKQHCEGTHNLPLPPNSMGEMDLGAIFNAILTFIHDKDTNDYHPLYTHHDCIHIVQSVIDFLRSDFGADNINLKLYPVQYLFYIMKEATCKVGELEKPSNFYITDAFFERDFFEYQTGIACKYHEEIDKSKYCTQSQVTRWGYMFSDYMCRDIAIELIPGRHCPKNTNINAIMTPAPSKQDDNASSVSVGTVSSYNLKGVADSKIYYDDQKLALSDDDSKTYDNSFPALATQKKVQKQASGVAKHSYNNGSVLGMMEDDDDDDQSANPWKTVTRKVPREPDSTHFNISYKDESDLDDSSSIASFGRGRGSLNTSLASRGSGRGRCKKH